jgi:hypothetical protein
LHLGRAFESGREDVMTIRTDEAFAIDLAVSTHPAPRQH